MEFPDYAYLPGHRPHPRRDQSGHSFGLAEPEAEWPVAFDSRLLLHAEALFDAGYYWEAHEAWEAVWLAAGRAGSEAELMQGLIKWAALAIKVRQDRGARLAAFATRVSEHFAAVGEDVVLGYDMRMLRQLGAQVSEAVPSLKGDTEPTVQRIFPWRLAEARAV
ncbi:MAG: hypothetical protein ACJAYU_002728 [Bradymonadia bacterium]|jgi:hypothetical protein